VSAIAQILEMVLGSRLLQTELRNSDTALHRERYRKPLDQPGNHPGA
jgi:hypothetical protein